MLKAGLAASFRMLRAALAGAFNIILALLLLFEEWGWQPLLAAFRWLERFRIVAQAEIWIASLSPYPALAVFAAPSLILFPVKIAGLWLLSHGQFIAAGALLAATKVASTALVARIFMLTRPALMQLAWFARLYDRFMPWKEALFARIRASHPWRYGRIVKARALRAAHRLADLVRPRILEALAEVRTRVRALWRRLAAGTKPRL